MSRLYAILVALTVLSAVAVAAEPIEIMKSAQVMGTAPQFPSVVRLPSDKSTLLRKFHVQLNQPKTFLDVPQENAGAGMSSYGGVFKNLLIAFVLLFSVSQLLGSPSQPSLTPDERFADVDDFELEDEQAQPEVDTSSPEEIAVAEAVPAAAAEIVVAAKIEAPLDHQSCVLLAQNDLFADDAAANALAERCWKIDKKARVLARAEQLLRLRATKRYSDIQGTLDPSSFEVFDHTANTPTWKFRTTPSFFGVSTQRTVAEVETMDGNPPTKLSAMAIPFVGFTYDTPFDSYSDQSKPIEYPPQPKTSLLLRQSPRNEDQQQEKEFADAQKGFLGAMAVVALAVSPAARRTKSKRKTTTTFPTNQHKSKPKVQPNPALPPHYSAWGGGMRHYDVIRSA
jgi:hypothetical protein